MDRAKFSIGIDLGTTNCAMAFEALDRDASSDEVFLIPQWESLTGFSEASTLPSFLYLPTVHEAAQVSGKGAGQGGWLPGRFARKQAAESPGRVAHSAKSWLCHHAVDRTAPFLPWRSDEIPVEQRISPIQASALLLQCLRAGWDGKFADQGADFRFNLQEITVTVPASFDAVAQRLTLEAAREAGYPDGVRLLEEPQAAFYYWLESHRNPEDIVSWGTGVPHVLVVDIGGGTSDFSLFEVSPTPGRTAPHIKRVAVSDHLLLGGDNIDLTLAHHLAPRLAVDALSGAQWNFLVARCRDLKERCLSDASGQVFPVSIPGRGSSLLGGTLACQVERTEVESIVLDGFFPECKADDRPAQSQAGLREWALPYAADSAITRYLADFLRDRPWVDAVLFNGGSLHPEALRRRLQQQIARWQHGRQPRILENSEPSLAVAWGAARFGGIVHRCAQRIEAGAARAIYLEVHQRAVPAGGTTPPTLVCILPRNAPSEEEFRVAEPGLELRLNRPVRFQPYYSTRHQEKAGSLVTWNDRDFHRLPPLQTTAKLPGSAGDRLPVILTARMNELGLLQVACISADPSVQASWPLEFNLRPHESGRADRIDEDASRPDPGVDVDRLDAARARLGSLFGRPLDRHDKLTAANLYKSLEQILRLPRADWNSVLIRSLWTTLYECMSHRRTSVEHEETWLILAGFLLRPGFGAEGDDARIDELWRLHQDGLAYPGKRVQLQLYILWRRVAGGLSRERQEAILAPELPRLRAQKNVPAELVRLAGSFERLDLKTKEVLIDLFLETSRELAVAKQYCAPYLTALGTLLNRAPLYAGADGVVPSVHVRRALETFSDLDWSQAELAEIQPLFLRAARMVNDPAVDVPKALRDKIASKLERFGVVPLRLARIRTFVPLAGTDRASLFGEALPPGLSLKRASE